MANIEEMNFHPERNNDDWRRDIEELLRATYGRFVFQKVNGDVRTMYCTLRVEELPEEYNKELSSRAKPGILVVYDYENDGWRSMRYDSVISFASLGDNRKQPKNPSTFVLSDTE